MIRRLAYAGVRQMSGKLAYCWHEVDNDGAVPNHRDPTAAFTKKNIVSYASPGQIYEVSSPNDKPDSYTMSGPNRPKFVGRIADEKLAKEWAVYSETERTHHEQEAMLRGEKREQLLDMTLRELIKLTRKMMPWRRRAMVAYIISKMEDV